MTLTGQSRSASSREGADWTRGGPELPDAGASMAMETKANTKMKKKEWRSFILNRVTVRISEKYSELENR